MAKYRFSGLWGAIAILLAMTTGETAMAQGAKPRPGKLETYRDWTIGCDNGQRCQANSLVPEDESDWDKIAAIVILRDPSPTAQPELTVRAQTPLKGVVELWVDGTKIASAPVRDEDAHVSGAAAFAAITALAKGNILDIRDGDGKGSIARASLRGSAAALRYMDAQQGRAGTTTALVATGKLGPQAVRAAPALPMVRRVAVPATGKTEALWRDELTRAQQISGCTEEYVPGNDDPEVFPLGNGQFLALISCGAGAYNFNSVALIGSGKAGRRTFVAARFDVLPGWGAEDGDPVLVNAGWDAAAGSLKSYAKGRGLGDCGSAETYAWDGRMFRLTEASQMGECRGAWDWITIFRAQVSVVKK